MALLGATDSGRITPRPTPSGSSVPPDLARLIAAQMAGGAGEGPAGVPLTISLNGKPAGDPIRLRRSNRVVESANGRTFSTIQEAVNSYFMLDDGYRDQIKKRMWYLGLLDGPNNDLQAQKVWAAAVESAWNYKQAGKDVNPLDMLGRMTNLKAGQLANQPRTITQRNINFTDPEQAKTWIREAFQNSMGRDPHDAEIRSMLRAIASGNAADPQVVQTTTDGEGNTTSRVLDPGFDPTAYIRNDIAADPEGAAYQAADTLYPALMEALRSPV